MQENTKAYCTCSGNKYDAFVGLFKVGPTKKGKDNFQFVHWKCWKPTEYVWRNWLTMCNICLGLFSSPWATICRACWREEGREPPYPGWSAARKAEGK